MKKNRSIWIVIAVCLVAVGIIVGLRFLARESDETEETRSAASTVPEATTATEETEPQSEPSVTFPEYAFTQVGDKVFATVQGGDGETRFEDTPELYTGGNEATVLEFVLEG